MFFVSGNMWVSVAQAKSLLLIRGGRGGTECDRGCTRKIFQKILIPVKMWNLFQDFSVLYFISLKDANFKRTPRVYL